MENGDCLLLTVIFVCGIISLFGLPALKHLIASGILQYKPVLPDAGTVCNAPRLCHNYAPAFVFPYFSSSRCIRFYRNIPGYIRKTRRHSYNYEKWSLSFSLTHCSQVVNVMGKRHLKKYTGGFIMAMNVEIKDNKLFIEIDLEKPTPSSSGKTLVVASTRGNVVTKVQVDGKPVTIGLNAYIKP
jgi:hypothetical protein